MRIVGPTGAVEASVKLGPNAMYAPAGAPAIAEVGGRTLVVQQYTQAVNHIGAPRAGDLSRLHVLTTGQPLCRAAWPMFKGLAARRAAVPMGTPGWRPFPCAAPSSSSSTPTSSAAPPTPPAWRRGPPG